MATCIKKIISTQQLPGQPPLCAAILLFVSVALRLNANTGEVFFPRLAFKIHTNRGKEIIEQKAVPAENDSFNIKVPVDTFVSAGLFGSHNCSRRLKDVEVVLLKKGLPVQTVQLGIGQNFDWDATRAAWRTKLPVVFNDSKGSLLPRMGTNSRTWTVRTAHSVYMPD